MLEMRQQCECCEKPLNDLQKDVYICSYECTYCADCADNDLKHVCPNCQGDLVIRPSRKAAE